MISQLALFVIAGVLLIAGCNLNAIRGITGDDCSDSSDGSCSVEVGSSRTRTIGFTGDRDAFRVALTANTVYRIQLDAFPDGVDFDAVVYHPNFSSTGVEGTRDGDEDFLYRPSANGNYYIIVHQGSGTGDYTLSVSVSPDDCRHTVPLTGVTHCSVEVGSSVAGIIEAEDDRDVFRAVLTDDTDYRIHLDLPDGADFNMRIYSELGIIVAAREIDDENFVYSWSSGSGPVRNRNTYIEVYAVSGTGRYTLSVSAATTVPPLSPSANYRVTLQSTWSQARNGGTRFPGGAHFSSLIGAVHNSSYRMWRAGAIASAGIESMAETGGTGSLRSEIMAQITAGNAGEVVSGGSISGAAGSVTVMLQATQQFPLVSLVTMLAPSPDWFIGVHDVQLYRNNGWVQNLEMELEVYDAGSDSGTLFTSGNADTQPKEPIARLIGNSDLGFVTSSQRVIGSMRFERIR